MRLPLTLRITTLVAANAVGAVLLGAVAVRVGEGLHIPLVVSVGGALLVAIGIAAWSAHLVTRRVTRTMMVVANGVRGLRENDLSLRLAATGSDEISEL